jgi:hypothetical protein
MRPIFELNDILQQDTDEDGSNEQQTTPLITIERPRTYSDSSITSIDGDEYISAIHLKRQSNRNYLGMISLSTSTINNQPQPFFSNDIELYGTKLVNPLLFLSSSSTI